MMRALEIAVMALSATNPMIEGRKSGLPLYRVSSFQFFWLARTVEISVFGCPLAVVFAQWSSGSVRLAGSQTTGSTGDGDNKTLNFKVSPEFKKEFKGFAVAQGITMTDLLKEGFALAKKKRR